MLRKELSGIDDSLYLAISVKGKKSKNNQFHSCAKKEVNGSEHCLNATSQFLHQANA